MYKHQEEAIEFLLQQRNSVHKCYGLLNHSMGLGKTLSTLTAIFKVRKDDEVVTIVTPSFMPQRVWRDEIAKWFPQYSELVHVVEPGSSGTKGNALLNAYLNGARIFIVGYPSLRHEGLVTAFAGITKHLVCDECHALKNLSTKTYKGVYEVAKNVETVYLLSGTPIRNHASEFYPMLKLMAPEEHTSQHAWLGEHFRKAYGAFGATIGDLKAPAAFRSMMEKYVHSRAKNMLSDLPPITRISYYVTMQGVQREAYRMMAALGAATLKGKVLTAPILLVELMRLKQIALTPGWHTNPELTTVDDSAKVDAMIELVSNTDEQVLVFTQFASAIPALVKKLNDEGHSAVGYTGSNTIDERDAAIAQFRSGEAKVLVLSLLAGSESLTLNEASVVIFLDQWWTPGAQSQAEARCHRIGQTKPVTVYRIMAEDSVDYYVQRMLDAKSEHIDSAVETQEVMTLSNFSASELKQLVLDVFGV